MSTKRRRNKGRWNKVVLTDLDVSVPPSNLSIVDYAAYRAESLAKTFWLYIMSSVILQCYNNHFTHFILLKCAYKEEILLT